MSNTAAIAQLKKDKILRKVINRVGELKPNKRDDLFVSLLKAIVSQQLSVKAASTIWGRFILLFDDARPEIFELLQLKDEVLRAVGLSYQKAGYLKNIARFSLEQGLDYKKLKNKTDDELIEYLVQIKGVGRWTVEMLLMFHLNRKDVFPLDDLGIQNGMKQLYLFRSEKKALFAEMNKVAEKWRPYRSLACMYIWRFKDDGVVKKKKP